MLASHEAHVVFGFEADFAHDLRCIPMAVRFKLDRVGVKLSLKQWARIGLAGRRKLASLDCETQDSIVQYRRDLTSMVGLAACDPIVELGADPDPSWADAAIVPAQVTAQAVIAGVAAPTQAQWAKLSTLQRFALLKLARSNHDNYNFVRALHEFELADQQSPLK